MRRTSFAVLVPLLAGLGLGPVAASVEGLAGADSSRRFVDTFFESLRVDRRECDPASLAILPGGEADPARSESFCAAYSGSFSLLKSDLDDLLRRHRTPDGLKYESPWRLDGRRYGRTWTLEECRIEVAFDERSGRLAARITPADAPSGSAPSTP